MAGYNTIRPIGRVNVNALAGVARPALAPPANAEPSQSMRARKDRGPNWLPQEVSALIAAKQEMYLEELDTIDGRDYRRQKPVSGLVFLIRLCVWRFHRVLVMDPHARSSGII